MAVVAETKAVPSVVEDPALAGVVWEPRVEAVAVKRRLKPVKVVVAREMSEEATRSPMEAVALDLEVGVMVAVVVVTQPKQLRTVHAAATAATPKEAGEIFQR